MYLCQSHFDQDVHRKIRETVRQTRLFNRSVRVAVGLSGGKKSATLFYVLENLFSHRKDIDLWAIIIDEGVEGRAALGCAQMLAESLKISYVVKSLFESSGTNLADPVEARKAFPSCGFAIASKKDILERTAQQMGADILATGHNLDDEALDVFLNYLHGDVASLFRQRRCEGRVTWIKPLQRIPEREIRLYAITHNLCFFDSPPRAELLCREAKRHLDNFDSRHPGTKYSLLHSRERVLELKEDGCDRLLPEGQSL